MTGISRVLVVDDEIGCRALQRLLTQKGWHVDAVLTLAEGIRALDAVPECVILDLSLPDGDGERVMEEIAARGLTTCVLVLSGISELGRIEAIRERFAPSAVFVKPVPATVLLAACEALRGDPSGQQDNVQSA